MEEALCSVERIVRYWDGVAPAMCLTGVWDRKARVENGHTHARGNIRKLGP